MGASALDSVIQLLVKGGGFLGGAIAIWGMIQLGMAIKDGATGGGGQLAGAIGMIVGGGIVCAAALLFDSLDTSWAG